MESWHWNRDKWVIVFAIIFIVFFQFSVKAFSKNKEELSNWFSPRVVGGFSKVVLTKNRRLIFCVCGWKYFCVFISVISSTSKFLEFVFSKNIYFSSLLNVWLWEWAFNYMGEIRRNWKPEWAIKFLHGIGDSLLKSAVWDSKEKNYSKLILHRKLNLYQSSVIFILLRQQACLWAWGWC